MIVPMLAVAIALLGFAYSVYIRRPLLALIIIIELLLLASILYTADVYLVLNEQLGSILIAIIITIAGAETSCSLALIVAYNKLHASIYLN